MLSTVAVVGFSSSYLRLRTQAPKLFAAVVLRNTVPALLTGIILGVTHWSADVPNLAFSALCGTGSIVAVFTLGLSVRSNYMMRERKRMEQDLVDATFDAEHDALTQLLNRRGLEARFEQLKDVASTVLFVDLDDFKSINDLAGHAAGDDALKIMARILCHAVRTEDIVARIGGDEFVIVLVGCMDPAVAAAVSERIATAVSLVRPLGEANPQQFGVSIGSAATEVGKSFREAIAGADADAYRVKAEHYAVAREHRRRSGDQAKSVVTSGTLPPNG